MGRVRSGVHLPLEEAANEILRAALAPLPRSQKTDVLTEWKERDRKAKEVYSSGGTVDPAIRRGMYHRAWNPDKPYLNSREGHTRPRRVVSTMDDDATPWDGGR